MGFFEKLGQGLKKTRDSIFGTIADMVSAGEITDELYDELEEQLILADTGAGVAVQLVDELRARVRSQRLKTGAEALDALKDIVKKHMQAEKELDRPPGCHPGNWRKRRGQNNVHCKTGALLQRRG